MNSSKILLLRNKTLKKFNKKWSGTTKLTNILQELEEKDSESVDHTSHKPRGITNPKT